MEVCGCAALPVDLILGTLGGDAAGEACGSTNRRRSRTHSHSLTDACRVATVVALRGCGRDATISSTAVQLMVMDSDTLEACLYEVLHMASWGAWGGRRGGKFVNGPSTIWALMICRSLSSSWLVRPRCGGQSQMFAAYPDHGGGERPWGHAGMMNWPCRLPNSRCVA